MRTKTVRDVIDRMINALDRWTGGNFEMKGEQITVQYKDGDKQCTIFTDEYSIIPYERKWSTILLENVDGKLMSLSDLTGED